MCDRQGLTYHVEVSSGHVLYVSEHNDSSTQHPRTCRYFGMLPRHLSPYSSLPVATTLCSPHVCSLCPLPSLLLVYAPTAEAALSTDAAFAIHDAPITASRLWDPTGTSEEAPKPSGLQRADGATEPGAALGGTGPNGVWAGLASGDRDHFYTASGALGTPSGLLLPSHGQRKWRLPGSSRPRRSGAYVYSPYASRDSVAGDASEEDGVDPNNPFAMRWSSVADLSAEPTPDADATGDDAEGATGPEQPMRHDAGASGSGGASDDAELSATSTDGGLCARHAQPTRSPGTEGAVSAAVPGSATDTAGASLLSSTADDGAEAHSLHGAAEAVCDTAAVSSSSSTEAVAGSEALTFEGTPHPQPRRVDEATAATAVQALWRGHRARAQLKVRTAWLTPG